MLISREEKGKIFQALSSYKPIFQSEALCGDDWEYINWERFSKILPLEDTTYGVSKGVLIPENRDYVIKVPFDGEGWEIKEVYDEEKEEYTECFEDTFTYFKNANEKYYFLSNWNYCELELFIYNNAVAKNLTKFFPETEKIGKIGGRPIYIQQRVTEIWAWSDIKSSISKQEQIDTINTLTSHNCKKSNLPYDFSAFVLTTYGLDEYSRLDDFLYQNQINDLHSSNLGILNDKPVIIDFSGYNV